PSLPTPTICGTIRYWPDGRDAVQRQPRQQLDGTDTRAGPVFASSPRWRRRRPVRKRTLDARRPASTRQRLYRDSNPEDPADTRPNQAKRLPYRRGLHGLSRGPAIDEPESHHDQELAKALHRLVHHRAAAGLAML